MSHFLSPPPSYFPERLRQLLRAAFHKAESQSIFEVGPISWRPNYGVFENLPFHASDNPYYFETSAGLKEVDERPSQGLPEAQFIDGFDRGPLLFTPAFTVFHKGTAAHLVYTSVPDEAELRAIRRFYEGHAVQVWQATLQENDTVSYAEIFSI